MLQVVERPYVSAVHDPHRPVSDLDMRPVPGLPLDCDVKAVAREDLDIAAMPAARVGNPLELVVVDLAEASDECSTHAVTVP
jgi:hypothetical protein